MSDYFRRRYKRFDGDISVKVDLSNYVTKTDLKNVSHVDVSSFTLKSNLASLKTEVDKIDADKLKTIPVDLAKLSNVVRNDAIKETEYDKLVAKVNGIDNTKFVSRTKYRLNTKVTEIEGKIPHISDLTTKSALTVVENKIPDVSSLVKKTDFNTKVTEIEGKIPDITNLVKKTDFNTKVTEIEGKIPDVSNLVKNTDFDTRLKKLVTGLLKIKVNNYWLKMN